MANELYNYDSKSFNLSAVLKQAHVDAAYERWMFSAPRTAYSTIFSKCLKAVWLRARLSVCEVVALKTQAITDAQRLSYSSAYNKLAA